MITNIGTTIATSVAQALADSNKKKTFVTKRANTMLKLMGSYLSLNKNGEEILIPGKLKEEMEQVMNTKNKHDVTIGFQTHYTATAVDLTNLSKLSMTSMYINPNAETYNNVRVEKIKTFDFLDNSLKNASLVYDNILTFFNYLSVDMSKNLAFRKMVRSDRVAKQDAKFEDYIQKRAPAPKSLFLDGEQRTLKDYMNLIGNICLEFHAFFEYLEKAVIYQMLQQFLHYLHTSQGWQWINTEITANKFYLHSWICVLQNTVTSMIRILCRNNQLIARVDKKKEVKSPSTIRDAKKCAQMFITDMKNESNLPAAGYKNKPKSYDYFKLGTQPTSHAVFQDEPVYDSEPKRRKTKRTTTMDTSKQNGNRDQSFSFAGDLPPNEVEKEKKKGILIHTGPANGKLPKYTPFIEGKRIYNGYVFVGWHYPQRKKLSLPSPQLGKSARIHWPSQRYQMGRLQGS